MRYVAVLGLALFMSLVVTATGAQPATADAKSVVEVLSANTRQTTSSGATFTAPAGWSVTSGPNKRVLDPPEGDSHIALVDVEAPDAGSAVASAWASYRPDARRPLKIALPQAPNNGWEERHLYSYETSPNEKIVVYALAWRAGKAWTVAIVEATRPTFEKRNAAISLTLGTLQPNGYQREMFAGKQARPLDAERIALLKDFAENVMRQFGIPGVGLSLIDSGQVVFEGGLGVKALGTPDPVDADTLFLAASNTKAMTTLLLAELVDENKLRWDQPVTEVYPSFKLGDAETTQKVLVKHLVCACTGLPRQDLEWLLNYTSATPASSLAIYQELVEINTTDSVGDSLRAAEAMAARLKTAGLPAEDVQVVSSGPRKGNLIARLRGTAARKPILLIAHLDVVEAKREDWNFNPFKLQEINGYFRGRGSIDDKSMASIFLANLIEYVNEGFKPDRDIILALTADEELSDSPHDGAHYLLDHYRALIDAEFAINEGGDGALRDGKPFRMSVQHAEKVYQTYVLEVTNPGGHSASGRRDNAIVQLADALRRLGQFDFPVALNAVTRVYLERMASIETPPMTSAIKALLAGRTDEDVLMPLTNRPDYNAVIRTTCVATLLEAGHAENALPQTARATVNCRILPDQQVAEVERTLNRVSGQTLRSGP